MLLSFTLAHGNVNQIVDIILILLGVLMGVVRGVVCTWGVVISRALSKIGVKGCGLLRGVVCSTVESVVI